MSQYRLPGLAPTRVWDKFPCRAAVALVEAQLLLQAAREALQIVPSQVFPLLRPAASAAAAAAAGTSGATDPLRQKREEKALYAAVVCVGRWGELISIARRAEAGGRRRWRASGRKLRCAGTESVLQDSKCFHSLVGRRWSPLPGLVCSSVMPASAAAARHDAAALSRCYCVVPCA